MGNMDYTYNFVIGSSCLNFGTWSRVEMELGLLVVALLKKW